MAQAITDRSGNLLLRNVKKNERHHAERNDRIVHIKAVGNDAADDEHEPERTAQQKGLGAAREPATEQGHTKTRGRDGKRNQK